MGEREWESGGAAKLGSGRVASGVASEWESGGAGGVGAI